LTIRLFVAAGLTALALFTGMAASAQDTQTSAMSPEDVTQDQVNAFVLAVASIEQMRQAYLPKIAEAESEEERQALAREVTQRAIGIVNRVKNITPGEYQQIAIMAQQDEVLMGRIRTRIDAVVAQAQAAQEGTGGESE